MNAIKWECKSFAELNTQQLFDLIKLRIDIFIVEQTCAYPELDEKDCDKNTVHLMGFDEDKIICCARLLAPGTSYPDTSIGRFAVAESYRQQGIGSALMNQCLQQISNIWPEHNIRISAQQYLNSFYSSFGFNQASDMYLEDGIPHIEMLKNTPHINDTEHKQ